MKLKLKKIFTTLLIVQMFLVNLVPAVRAEEGTVTENSVTVESNATPTPSVESTVQANSEQTVQSEPPSPTPTLTPEQQEDLDEEQALMERRARSEAAAESFLEDGDIDRVVSETSAAMLGTDPGDSKITTGDATSTGLVVNSANNNLAGSAGVTGDPSGAAVVTSGNGSSSNNSGALAINNDSATIQNNDADVNTGLNQSATTGNNTNSSNTGVNSTTETGDANVTGTVINAVNTNVDGVMVSEFNVADNHTGDLVLDFGAGCISGCGTGSPTTVKNTGNGSYSNNDASVDQVNNNETVQINDALVNSELVLSADSGYNTSSDNTGGDTSITTGNANVEANALTFANNNIAGDVVYAVVNIFGNLVGDIIMTQEALNAICGSSCFGGDVTAANIGNGSGSTNDASVTTTNNDAVFQSNDVNLGNDLVLDASTGDNSTSNNTGGDSSITTGNTDITANVLNIVNANLVGGTMWLVIVNEAGKWIGHLLGAPDGSNMAASAGTEFTIDENGNVTATNSGNGTGSNNDAAVSQTNNNSTTQENTANVQNTLNLSANTGGNQANSNTGGNTTIQTGDATIIANLVNFINNNIVGDGKLVVTVVNVFGSWFGDFVGPGQQKQNHSSTDTSQTVSNNSGGSSSSSSNTSTNSNSSNNGSSQGFVASIKQSLHIEQTGEGEQNGTTTVTQGGSTVAVAGISTNNSDQMIAGKDKKKVRINLAWLLFLIPLAGAVIIGRKIVYARLLAKKN